MNYLNRRSSSSDDSSTPSDLNVTENATKIGNPIPVVLGRALIKSPLIAYFGGFESKIYTETYAAHANFNAFPLVFALILQYIAAPVHVTGKGIGNAGPYPATVTIMGKDMLVGSLINTLFMWLLSWLINGRNLKTTIQKGFKYYLGYQYIICWTGDNIQIRNIYMNDKLAWNGNVNKLSNLNGYSIDIDNEDLFGGVDEQGGFVGKFNMYFGTDSQPADAWMIDQMSLSSVQQEVRGLTPKYKRFLTAVIPKAYIGKQAVIPTTYIEVVNLPSKLGCKSIGDDANPAEIIYEIYTNTDWGLALPEDRLDKDALIKIGNALDEGAKAVGYLHRDGIDYIKFTASNVGEKYNDLEITIQEPKHAGGSTPFDVDGYKITIYAQVDPVDGKVRISAKNIVDLFNNTDNEKLNRLVKAELLQDNVWVDLKEVIKFSGGDDGEGLGLSILITNVQEVNNTLNQIMEHINAVKYTDPSTGKLTFKLIRDDYDVDKIPKLSISNCKSCTFNRLDWTETVSNVVVSFTDASSKYETVTVPAFDPANAIITKKVASKTYDFPLVTKASLAYKLAQREQGTNGYPLATATIETNRTCANMNIGDAFMLSWMPYGVKSMIMRVVDIDKGQLVDGKITITAIEDIYGFKANSTSIPDGGGWQEIVLYPTGVSYYDFKELPYEITKSRDTFVSALAARPTTITTKWSTWREQDGETVFTPTNETTIWSAIGSLWYNIPQNVPNYFYKTGASSPVPACITDTVMEVAERANGHMIAKFIRNYNYLDPNNYTYYNDMYEFSTLIMIDEEIMLVRGIQQLPNGNFKLYSVERGVCDTVPKSHKTNALVYFLNPPTMLNVTGTSIVCTEGLTTTEKYNITTASINRSEDFDPVKVKTVTTVDRANRPSPPMNVLVKPYPSSAVSVQTRELVANNLTGFGLDTAEISADYNVFSAYLDVADYGIAGGFYSDVDRISSYGIVMMIEEQDKFTQTFVHQKGQSIESGCNYKIKLAMGSNEVIKYIDVTTDKLSDKLVNMHTYDYVPNQNVVGTYQTDKSYIDNAYPISSFVGFSYSWADLCKDFKTGLENDLNIYITTNRNSVESVYGWDKTVKLRCPTIVNIFDSSAITNGDIATYITDFSNDQHINLPVGDYSSSSLLVRWEEMPIFLIGTKLSANQPGAIMDGNGDYWIPLKYVVSFRTIDINGTRTNLVEIDFTDDFIVSSYFNPDKSKTTLYYKWDTASSLLLPIGNTLP